MAKLHNRFKFSGTIGGLTYRQTKTGTVVCAKSSLDAKRIQTDPRFERTRQNGNEFGYSARLASALNKGFHSCWEGKITGVHCRFVKLIMQVLKLDKFNPRGSRQVTPEHLEKLKWFDFNKDLALSSALPVNLTVFQSRRQGKFVLRVDPFVPGQRLQTPSATTHYKLTFVVIAVDLASLELTSIGTSTEHLRTFDSCSHELMLEVMHPATQGKSIVFGLGIQFYTSDRREFYPVTSLCGSACSIIDVDP